MSKDVAKSTVCDISIKQQFEKQKNVRESGIELYRIVTMLLIICSHYVHNSGLLNIIKENPFTVSSIMWFVFGFSGKIGINCFVLIK